LLPVNPTYSHPELKTMIKNTTPPAITEREAAERLQMSQRTLQAWRTRGEGPRFLKLGRSVRYTEQELDSWMAARTMANTCYESEGRP
jgi:excisionase family DNA binding protein